MDRMFKNMFKKDLTPEDAEEKRKEFFAPAGIRESTTPYETLRKSMRRMFPYYPDVFDYTGQMDETEKD